MNVVLRISQVKINVSQFYKEKQDKISEKGWENVWGTMEQKLILKKITSMLRIEPKQVKEFYIIKQSVDARKKQEIFYNYSVDLLLDSKLEEKLLAKDKKHILLKAVTKSYVYPEMGKDALKHPPVVIGFGPAGMFCALQLALMGYRPIVLEQGLDVDTRVKDVNEFWEHGKLNVKSNVQFGEGGAGTFSDGKLNTSIKDATGRIRKVLEIFVEHGANPEILYMQKPHIGTDALCEIVKNIRLHIEQLGGEVRFKQCVTNLRTKDGILTGIEINHKEWMDVDVAVFAIGHSARDTFRMLYEKQLTMEKKPFAIGVRVEHKQKMIDKKQYGELGGILPAADYKLTYQAKNGRSIFSFCMCPGGIVVNASSEEGHLVVNGMSNHKRDEENANSALVVNVTPDDFPTGDVLSGVEFQRKWEKMAFEEGNGLVPIQLLKDFKEKRKSTVYGEIMPVHKGNVTWGNLWNCLPEYVCDTLVEGMDKFGQMIEGYDHPDTLLSGVETRTSSPVRIVRDDEFESNIKGIYPCGEGAGYAGGITSAAIDGIKVFEAILRKYAKTE